jgi:hypothetical protein
MLYLHVIPNIPNDFHISIMELWSYLGFFSPKITEFSEEKPCRETGSAGPGWSNGAEAMTSMTWVSIEGTALGR